MESQTPYFKHCFIAGLQHHDVLTVWSELKVGQVLRLVPEPANRFDHHAIIIKHGDVTLGYILRNENREMSKILNAGHENIFELRIQSIYPERGMTERIEVCVRILPPKPLVAKKKPVVKKRKPKGKK